MKIPNLSQKKKNRNTIISSLRKIKIGVGQNLKKSKPYRINCTTPMILKPDPIFYGKLKIENHPQILR